MIRFHSFERPRLRAWGLAVVCIFLLGAIFSCRQTPTQKTTTVTQQTPPAELHGTAWHFAVSGDSRNCGDLVMPAIAADVKKQSPIPHFYWHLGDFRWMLFIDQDMEHGPIFIPLGYPATPDYIEHGAWEDFKKNQLEPFKPIQVYLGIGNHELYGPFQKQLGIGIRESLGIVTDHPSRPGARSKYMKAFSTYLPDAKDLHIPPKGDDYTSIDYHWTIKHVDFIFLDNASSELAFDKSQLDWFEQVLRRDKIDASIQTVVVGMHAALPGSIASKHSMDQYKDKEGKERGCKVYQDLLEARDDFHRNVYILASHAHYFADDIFSPSQLQIQCGISEVSPGKGVLKGWIVGTAGAHHAELPEGVKTEPRHRQPNVYGYLLGTVNPDDRPNGEIRFEFKEIRPDRRELEKKFEKPIVNYCLDDNR